MHCTVRVKEPYFCHIFKMRRLHSSRLFDLGDHGFADYHHNHSGSLRQRAAIVSSSQFVAGRVQVGHHPPCGLTTRHAGYFNRHDFGGFPRRRGDGAHPFYRCRIFSAASAPYDF